MRNDAQVLSRFEAKIAAVAEHATEPRAGEREVRGAPPPPPSTTARSSSVCVLSAPAARRRARGSSCPSVTRRRRRRWRSAWRRAPNIWERAQSRRPSCAQAGERCSLSVRAPTRRRCRASAGRSTSTGGRATKDGRPRRGRWPAAHYVFVDAPPLFVGRRFDLRRRPRRGGAGGRIRRQRDARRFAMPPRRRAPAAAAWAASCSSGATHIAPTLSLIRIVSTPSRFPLGSWRRRR